MPTFHAAPPRKRLKPLPPDLRPRRHTFEFKLDRFARYEGFTAEFKNEMRRLFNHFQISPQIDRAEQLVTVLLSQAFKEIASQTAPDLRVQMCEHPEALEKTLTITFTSRPKIGQKLRAALKLP